MDNQISFTLLEAPFSIRILFQNYYGAFDTAAMSEPATSLYGQIRK